MTTQKELDNPMPHCLDHDACLGKIYEKLDKISEVICGGTATVGFAELLRDLERRVEVLEGCKKAVKKGVWALVERYLPWLLVMLFAGMQSSGFFSPALSRPNPPAQNVLNAPGK